ncbi:GNAT family N-acetyltransferase [Chitinophaga solisilvae]|uniref:GNAT family N-acetyltransferase n=1 Tax=Chitinophaga solisilvae TaxID=1233460 RepID=UPI00136F18DC|nr:GNAT family N-acetyltransferase [Chitinophaga solisilvae]
MTFLHDFHDLRAATTEVISETFNEAFSDYIVPLHLTPSILEQKMKAENLQRQWSIGAFNQDELGAFILHGTDSQVKPQVLYNGGTGVIPAYRGQHLIQKMYEQFIPVYKRQGIKKILLEVITSNLPAIKAYTNSGFSKVRHYHCYKGTVATHKTAENISIEKTADPDWQVLSTFMDQEPSWSNTIASITREHPFTATWQATLDGQPVGFISVHKESRRIRNIAVHPGFRRQGIGSSLLQHASGALNGPMSIINIDDKFPEISRFLEQAGLGHYLSQYEMAIML